MPTIITIHFAQQLYPRQLKAFKDFLDDLAWKHEKILLKNNLKPDVITNKTPDGKNINQYPLVQCKIIRRQVALMGIAEGAKALKVLLPYFGKKITLGETTFNFSIIDIQQSEHNFTKLRKPKQYHLYHWLAFNKENLEAWNTAHSMANKIPLLEKILYGQINDCIKRATGKNIIGLKNTILDINNKTTTKYREFEKFVEMEIIFESNVSLPAEIALGKGKSVGFGKLLPTNFYKGKENWQPRKLTQKKPQHEEVL
jgi:hypothetical protein